MKARKSEWFREWFNSPYYHLLYRERDHAEAKLFIDRLTALLKPSHSSRMLDAGCGRGRHSLYLNEKGFDVTGIDLSEENIKYCSAFAGEKLNFFCRDFRKPFGKKNFDFAFSLFTSMGYSGKEKENASVIASLSESLRPGGYLVLDYINGLRAEKHLVAEEKQMTDGVSFELRRSIENGFILKDILVNDNGSLHSFSEKVKIIQPDIFEKYFKASGLRVLHLFGDYELSTFDENFSDRIIIIGKKKS